MDDIDPLVSALESVWNDRSNRPQLVIGSAGWVLRFARSAMRKRQFRRWRGKYRAAMRRERLRNG